ncbi:hypothetical protein D1B31_01040 [Neobacillus notoginsengisoli]|uniref:Uncharacterized protein n=1 Tax=Neobacillus notoginsengisoli TaxID=1578198 RepID=A0A417Z019_9BACI|nr:hypothetical protein [Neobacillus notoginsengisoli]RHW43288.1 hypothetical protein D1B31_01040 [Neobacillus notoginsengisoli]
MWWIIGMLNIVLAAIELILGIKNRGTVFFRIHLMFSLMFVSFGVAAFYQNLSYGAPGLIIGLLAVWIRSKNRITT